MPAAHIDRDAGLTGYAATTVRPAHHLTSMGIVDVAVLAASALALAVARITSPPPALALDRKKLAAFSALGAGFLQFPIGDRRCNRTRASVGNAGGNARPSLTNATLAASRLLHRRSPGDELMRRRPCAIALRDDLGP